MEVPGEHDRHAAEHRRHRVRLVDGRDRDGRFGVQAFQAVDDAGEPGAGAQLGVG